MSLLRPLLQLSLAAILLASTASAFAPPSPPPPSRLRSDSGGDGSPAAVAREPWRWPPSTVAPLVAVVAAAAAGLPLPALSEDGAAEIVSELPPPYVPVALAVGLIGGVGWLTTSLGDVMDEEASLGLQSGARAKKERERASSSYFKRK